MTEQSFQTTREKVIENQDHQCKFCGVTEERHIKEHDRSLDVHHIIPRSADGSDLPHNLMAVCVTCHKTLEHTQSKALKRINQSHLNQPELDELKERTERLEDLVGGMVEEIHRLERELRNPHEWMRGTETLSFDAEVVTRRFGNKSLVTTDSEKAKTQYDEWGSSITRTSVMVDWNTAATEIKNTRSKQ